MATTAPPSMDRCGRPASLMTAACALVLLASGVAGCADSSASGMSGASTPAVASSAPAAGRTLFSDSFDDDSNGWALPPNENATSVVEGGDFVWESRSPDLRPHLIPKTLGDAFDAGTLAMRDVVVTASVTPERGKAAMGVFCREVRDTDADFQWYEFVARDGYAAIRIADSAGHLAVLSKTTNVRLPLMPRTTISGTCVDSGSRAHLWLTINGAPVLSTIVADPLGNGAPGLQAYDAPANASAERFLIRWHDFTVEAPQGVS